MTKLALEGVKVLEAASEIKNFNLNFIHYPLGSEHYLKTGELITENALNEIKNSLKSQTQLSQISGSPPLAPIPLKQQKSINSLNPPPPPLNSATDNIRSLPKRTELISELKEMFIKRGLTTKYDL